MMMHRPVLLLILVILSGLAVSPQPARAGFGDCAIDGYLGRFPEAPTALGLNCIELFRIDVSTSGGPRQIRGIQDISADWAFSPGATVAVERGARLAANAFSRLGDFRIDDVTLLILDDAHGSFFRGERHEVLAITDGRSEPDAGRPGECLITLYMLGRGGDPDSLAVTVAHEIFHCLQYASLSTGQMATVGAGGDWWIEGSAEYFSALAVPESLPFTDRSSAFDAAVSSGKALNAMAHEAAIFFYWLHSMRGPSGLMPFQHAMAASGSAPAQHAAMRAQLPDDQWLRFAEDYTDQAINHPQGGALALNPPGGDVLSFDENETLEFPLEAFVIRLGTVEYTCGEWSNTLSPENTNLAVQETGASSWTDYPDEVDARDGAGTYRIVALHTGSGETALSIEVERTVVCEPCGGSDRVDACLVGTWFMSGGGPIEWMRGQGIPITASHSGPRIITYRDDGVYGTDAFAAGLTLRTEDMIGVSEGFLTVAAGRWSAGEGRMAICQDSGGLSGQVTVTSRVGTRTIPISQPGAGQLSLGYSCSESTLTTTLDFPGLSPMLTHYTKVPEIVPPVAE